MTKPIPKPFKLCYVRHNILYFTDDFEKQWGDDWDDAPYQHNAGDPYEWEDDWPEYKNEHRGHIRYIWYMPKSCDLQEAYLRHQDISVEEINKGIVPWLTNGWNGKQGLYAGATLDEAGKWLTVAGVLWGELTRGRDDVFRRTVPGHSGVLRGRMAMPELRETDRMFKAQGQREQAVAK